MVLATATTVAVLIFVALTRPNGPGSPGIEKGQPVPDIAGSTLDGAAFRLADLRGRPVLVNFWGPSCVPCRTEFPLLKANLAQHAGTGLAIVGVLTDDPPAPAADFVRDFGATWPTVVDPERTIKAAWRVAARPQTYFVDGGGILRSIQIGELTDADFERQLALILRCSCADSALILPEPGRPPLPPGRPSGMLVTEGALSAGLIQRANWATGKGSCSRTDGTPAGSWRLGSSGKSTLWSENGRS